MIPLSLSWSFGAVLLLWSSLWPQVPSALSPENEVPLRPATWLPEGKITQVRLPAGRTVRLYFTLKKKTSGMSVTVSPCDLTIEWSLAARTVKEKPFKSLQWITKKSTPEVWWRGPGTEQKIHSFSGDWAETFAGPAPPHTSIYILRLRSKQHNSRATVYLQDGAGPSGAFPSLPNDTRVRTLGVGMTSVTLNWLPSPSVTSRVDYEYCVLVNSKNNYPSLCAAQESNQKKTESVRNRKEKKRRMTPWPILKEWWWEQWERDPDTQHADEDVQCVCKGAENVCTVSELLPDTQYYFNVFVLDKVNKTSVAYTGADARTHEEARPDTTGLREGELRWVNFPHRNFHSEQLFSFLPRGWQQSGLLTLQSCGRDEKVKVTVSGKGQVLETQTVGGDLVQIWLQGSPSYLIHLEREGTPAGDAPVALPAGLTASVKMQTSSAYHKRGVPSLPSTFQIKSFNKLRTCSSVTIAWMGTEERSLYCVYRRRFSSEEAESGKALALHAPCLGPESRSDTERVLCKYFQELNPRRAVTTAVIGGLEPGVAYVFDVYLMRRWGIPVKYTSKMVKTRRDC